jgi:short-subunit dehydrogenase
MSRWKDKVVLVTGGSSGLGLAIAESFAQKEARVVLVAREEAKLVAAVESTSAKSTVFWLRGDVTQAADGRAIVQQVLEQERRLDVLVNCAGRSGRGLLADTPPQEFQSMWELNVLGAVHMVQAALPHLTTAQGHIVNIGSLASKSAARYLGAYSTTKFALAGFTQQLRLEVGPGVHVLLVCPGPIARSAAGERYAAEAANLPASAKKPGGGVKLGALRPEYVAARIVTACERRVPELVIPAKAKLLFAISQLSARLGDWLVRRMT